MNETDQAAADIMEILMGLPSPKHASAAIATVRANLFIQGGATNGEHICSMMGEDDKAAFEAWIAIASAAATSARNASGHQ